MNPNRIDHEGTLPQGKLHPRDEGGVSGALSYDKENDLIILQFERDIGWLAYTPSGAIDIANQIISFANRMITETKDKDQ